MGRRPPSFDFYPSAFRDGVRRLTLEQIGAYALLLCEQFEVETLPATDEELRLIMHNCDEATFRRIWANLSQKFERTEHGFKNAKLAEERELAIESWNGSKKKPPKRSTRKSPVPPADVALVMEHYKAVYHPTSRPGDRERDLILARLKEGYSVNDLLKAVDGCHVSPFHCGENERGMKYQSLGLIVRDSKHVVEFMEAWDERNEPVLSEKLRRGSRARQSYLQLRDDRDE